MSEKKLTKWKRNAREGYVDRMDKHYWNMAVNLVRKEKKEITILIAVSTVISAFLNIIYLNYKCR